MGQLGLESRLTLAELGHDAGDFRGMADLCVAPSHLGDGEPFVEHAAVFSCLVKARFQAGLHLGGLLGGFDPIARRHLGGLAARTLELIEPTLQILMGGLGQAQRDCEPVLLLSETLLDIGQLLIECQPRIDLSSDPCLEVRVPPLRSQ